MVAAQRGVFGETGSAMQGSACTAQGTAGRVRFGVTPAHAQYRGQRDPCLCMVRLPLKCNLESGFCAIEIMKKLGYRRAHDQHGRGHFRGRDGVPRLQSTFCITGVPRIALRTGQLQIRLRGPDGHALIVRALYQRAAQLTLFTRPACHGWQFLDDDGIVGRHPGHRVPRPGPACQCRHQHPGSPARESSPPSGASHRPCAVLTPER